MEQRCIHAIVTGRVQGVFFRDNTQKQALELNIQGWVRNKSDGSVELIAKGDEENIEKLITWLHHGPKMARVDDLSVSDESTEAHRFETFDITG